MRKYELPKKTLATFDFRFDGVDVDYETNRNCNCDLQNDYCRCRTIENARVERVEMNQVVSHVAEYFSFKNKDTVDLYCIDRILSAYKVWNPEAWDVRVCGGYYGEEIEGVYLKKGEEIETKIMEVLCLDSVDAQIEALMVLEYGYLLDTLRDCHYEICTIDKTKISHQREHYVKLDRETVESYKDYPYPRGIVKAQDNRYRLIDGYHRVAASPEQATVFVAKEK